MPWLDLLAVVSPLETPARFFSNPKSKTAPPPRLVGVRMVFADAALSSLVVTSAAALAAFPLGTLPSCDTAESRVAAVHTALAARIASASGHAVDLSSTSLLSSVLTAAATGRWTTAGRFGGAHE